MRGGKSEKLSNDELYKVLTKVIEFSMCENEGMVEGGLCSCVYCKITEKQLMATIMENDGSSSESGEEIAMNIGKAFRVSKRIITLIDECSNQMGADMEFFCDIQQLIIQVLLDDERDEKKEEKHEWVYARLIYYNNHGDLVDYVTKFNNIGDARKYADDRLNLSNGKFTAHYWNHSVATDDIPF